MLLIELLLLAGLLPLFLQRWFRWLAIVQQKEYRVDRLLSFFYSAEGQENFFTLFPRAHDFTRTGLKRPVRTMRVAVVGLISFALMAVWFAIGYQLGLLFLFAILAYVLLPVALLISCMPSVILAFLLTEVTLQRARQKLIAGHPQVIGIGGSYGKTSTKHLLSQVLAQKFSVFVTPKSHNTKYSVAKSICESYAGQEIAILEYGAYKQGEISVMTKWFLPQMAVETGFTLQHLGLFGSAENSLHAESELIAALPSDGIAFCNTADEGAAKICALGQQKNQVKVISYTGPTAEVLASQPKINAQGQLSFTWEGEVVQTQLIGAHYLPNILAVLTVGQHLGLSKEQLVTGLTSFVPSSSFVCSQVLSSGALLIDDGGTSNPKGFMAAIELARALSQQKKILVCSGIVDLGTETSAVHQELAQLAQECFDAVLYLGEEGRVEFSAVFDDRLLNEEQFQTQFRPKFDSQTLILIEGRIPKALENVLYEQNL